MRQTRRRGYRFAALAVLAVLVAAPGVHLFERFLEPSAALWLSHGLALLLLGVAAWRWRATRARSVAPDGRVG